MSDWAREAQSEGLASDGGWEGALVVLASTYGTASEFALETLGYSDDDEEGQAETEEESEESEEESEEAFPF